MKLSHQDTLGLILLVLAVIVGLTIRVSGALDKKTFEHDEAHSYLSATGHWGTYMDAIYGTDQSLVGHWVEASRWKRFLRVEDKFLFGEIRRDLAHYDHPPLYFWLLHLWVRWFGINSLSGLSINFVFFLLTVFVLFMLGQYIFRNIFEASLGALLWALSPATIITSLMARNWEMVTFLTVLFVLLTIQYVDGEAKPRKRELFALVIVACLGSLTNYQFLLIVLPAGIMLVVLKLAKRDLEKLVLFLASILLGCLLAFSVHPDFINSFLIAKGYAQPFTISEISFRIFTELACFLSFFTGILQRIGDGGVLFDPTHSTPTNLSGIVSVLSCNDFLVILVVMLFWIGIGCSIYLNWRAGGFGRVESMWHSPQGSFLWFAVYLVGSVTLECLAFVVPKEAMRERHFSMLWPFVALALVMLIRYTGRKFFFSVVLIGLFLFVGVNQALHFHWFNEKIGDPGRLFEKAPSLVVDTFIEGKLLPILWHVPDETMVYVASQKYLIEHEEQWLDGLRDGGIIVSVLGYGDTKKENQEQIVRIAAARCRISNLHIPSWRWTTLFKSESCYGNDHRARSSTSVMSPK